MYYDTVLIYSDRHYTDRHYVCLGGAKYAVWCDGRRIWCSGANQPEWYTDQYHSESGNGDI
jgi:hypothetical protein